MEEARSGNQAKYQDNYEQLQADQRLKVSLNKRRRPFSTRDSWSCTSVPRCSRITLARFDVPPASHENLRREEHLRPRSRRFRGTMGRRLTPQPKRLPRFFVKLSTTVILTRTNWPRSTCHSVIRVTRCGLSFVRLVVAVLCVTRFERRICQLDSQLFFSSGCALLDIMIILVFPI